MIGLDEDKPLIDLYLNSTSEGVFSLDSDLKLLSCNNRYLSIIGGKCNLVSGFVPSSLQDGWHDPGFYNRIMESVNSHNSWVGETWDKRKDDDTLFVMNQKIVKYGTDDAPHYLGIIQDITADIKAQQELQYFEQVDQATNISNRYFGEKQLEIYLEDQKNRVALIFMDVNNFSSITETFGHKNGDAVLKEIAIRVKDSILSESMFSFGADRFVIYFPYQDVDSIEDTAFEIIDLFNESFEIDGNDFFLSVNLGITLYDIDGTTPDELIRNADSAKEESRKEGNNTFSFYRSEMNESVLEQFQLMGDLRKSIERNELSLVYQPQVDSFNSKIVGVESLIRWNNGKRGFVSPDKFIPIAEKKGLIIPIGEWVLRTACNQFVDWDNQGIDDVSMAINISGEQFNDKRLLPLIKNIFYGKVDTSKIELEITESAFVDDVDMAIKTMQKLKDMGFKLAIDDFGTGFSSLSYLKQFPVDKLKIDRMFITNLLEESGDLAIVKAIISLSENLGLNVIAEGVEDINQRDYVLNLGCPLIQGYFYSKPLTSTEFIEFYKQGIK
ncbi:MAG: hypothetical protein B6229_01830 [Spirochaetaceae bacterium 4572_7]|nr:MAG: hypothetical protein B6229_01830 [Spirochaetaceae bacterium 4572_7]